MPYLVDGNNLAHALGLSNEGLADRESCARMVAAFCRTRGARATIVFDGPLPQGASAGGQTDRLCLVFSNARSADDVILRLVSESKTPRDFIVVTSDKSLGDKARHRGATVERAHEFAKRLDRSSPKEDAAPDKPGGKVSSEDVDAWLVVFDPKRK